METPIAEVFVVKRVFFMPALKSFGTKHYRAQLKPTLHATRKLFPTVFIVYYTRLQFPQSVIKRSHFLEAFCKILRPWVNFLPTLVLNQ